MVVTLNVPRSEMARGGPVISPRKLHCWAVRAFIPEGNWTVHGPESPAWSQSRNYVPSPYGLRPNAVRSNPRHGAAPTAAVPA